MYCSNSTTFIWWEKIVKASTQAICLYSHSTPDPQPHLPGISIQNKVVWERERQLEPAEAASMAVISRLASTPLPWVQWLSGKSTWLVIGRSRVRLPAGSLCIFLSLSPKLTSMYGLYTKLITQMVILRVHGNLHATIKYLYMLNALILSTVWTAYHTQQYCFCTPHHSLSLWCSGGYNRWHKFCVYGPGKLGPHQSVQTRNNYCWLGCWRRGIQ